MLQCLCALGHTQPSPQGGVCRVKRQRPPGGRSADSGVTSVTQWPTCRLRVIDHQHWIWHLRLRLMDKPTTVLANQNPVTALPCT